MYKITKDNEVLATVNTPTWVRVQANGCYGLCNADSAQGVVVDGTVYHVSGKPDMGGVETVILIEISETAYQLEQLAAKAEQASMNDDVTAALVELAGIVAGMGVS